MKDEHEALVEAAAQAIAIKRGDYGKHTGWLGEGTRAMAIDEARAVLALIFEKLQTMTPGMRDAIWNTRVSFEQAWADAPWPVPSRPPRQPDRQTEARERGDGRCPTGHA